MYSVNADELKQQIETLKLDNRPVLWDNILGKPELFLTQERFDTIRDMYYIQFKKKAINRYNNIEQYLSPDEWNVEYALGSLNLDELKLVYDKYFKNWYKSVDRTEFN